MLVLVIGRVSLCVVAISAVTCVLRRTTLKGNKKRTMSAKTAVSNGEVTGKVTNGKGAGNDDAKKEREGGGKDNAAGRNGSGFDGKKGRRRNGRSERKAGRTAPQIDEEAETRRGNVPEASGKGDEGNVAGMAADPAGSKPVKPTIELVAKQSVEPVTPEPVTFDLSTPDSDTPSSSGTSGGTWFPRTEGAGEEKNPDGGSAGMKLLESDESNDQFDTNAESGQAPPTNGERKQRNGERKQRNIVR